jgi:superfamily II DNA helicase RecQ
MTANPVQLDSAAESPDPIASSILAVLKQFWGFDSLRPMQMEAIRAGLSRRDSLVVLPPAGASRSAIRCRRWSPIASTSWFPR